MKKKLGLIALDPSLAQWLSEKLRTAPDPAAAGEMREGLAELMSGTADSLMLELGDGGTPAFLEDTIVCGALSIDLRLRRVVRDGVQIPLTPKEIDNL